MSFSSSMRSCIVRKSLSLSSQVSPFSRPMPVTLSTGEDEDAVPGAHLGDHLIGLMRSDVHLDVGGGLQEFSHPGKFPDG